MKEGQTVHRTVGIDICESDFWSRNKGTNALCAFIQYDADCQCKEIYTQTWHGNVRMIHLAEKLGFQECNRDKGEREVRGEKYDGLTFMLKI